MPSEKTYTIAAGVWPRSAKITIESRLGTRIARLPLNFLATCGDNTWSYVSYVLSLLVIADPLHPGCIVDPQTGMPVDGNAAPFAGTFHFIEEGESVTSSDGHRIDLVLGKSSEVSFAFGPTSASSVSPASGVEAQSISDRSRHSTDQVSVHLFVPSQLTL
jgi:hypothetical protein